MQRQEEKTDGPNNSEINESLAEIPAPPDGGWGWAICFASFACNLILDGISYSFGLLLVPLVTYFDSTRSEVAWVGSLLSGVYMSSGPIVAGLVNTFGCRPVCVTGGIVSSVSLVMSVFSSNVPTLMITYGILGGFGMGLIYLPSVIACGYYFEKRRALATGISVCGSGVGCFIFAPLTNLLLRELDWKGTSVIFAGFCLNCCVFGSLMRPLRLSSDRPELEYRSSKCQDDKLIQKSGIDDGNDGNNDDDNDDDDDDDVVDEIPSGTCAINLNIRRKTIAHDERRRVSSAKPLRLASEKIPRNISTSKLDDRFGRRISVYGHVYPDGTKLFLEPTGGGGGGGSFQDGPVVRPLSRKDVFYSGSVYKLAIMDGEKNPRDFINRYRHSVMSISNAGSHISIPAATVDDDDGDDCKNGVGNKCWKNRKSGKFVLREILDLSHLFDPLFLLICLSNVFGFLALYIPYMYLPNMITMKGISEERASFVVSVIGISNTIGRVIFGWLVDLPWISSIIVTNVSLVMTGICIFAFPFCIRFEAYLSVALAMGFSVSAYISLTSIVLVDLLGLDALTSTFGLLVLFRGLATILGPPIGGAIYDLTNDYDPAFYLSGLFFVIGGMFSQMAYHIKQRKRKDS